MKIHRAGYNIILVTGFLFLILALLSNQYFQENNSVHLIFYGAELFFYFLIIRFFRIPKREIIPDENSIICAADGKVVAIEEVFVDEYFKDKRIQVSVFMSPLNVHVNFYPVAGAIKFAVHHAGKFYPAFLPKSSTENEHSTIVLAHKNNKEIMIRQIAGSVARRIVFHSKVSQQVQQFEEMGIIKFGSRVDLFLPTDARINVKLFQKVKAGKDIIAYFK